LAQDFADIRHVIDTNVTGTVQLVHRLGRGMEQRRAGRILITGSIAGLMPGTYQAVYNASKAFLDSFAYALRAELAGTGVTVTCLMPGATDTEFFERADMLDTKVGAGKKMSAAEVARAGFDALMRGEAGVVTGWENKLRAALSHVLPDTLLAEQHRAMSAPGTSSRVR
jgi:short-subunit dehydrogenase